MAITWEQFYEMYNEAFGAKDRMLELAETKLDEDKEEYLRLAQFVINTTSKLLEMTGDYTPSISNPKDREVWIARKEEVKRLRLSVTQNQGRWWHQ